MKSYKCDHCGLCCKHLIIEASAVDVLREPLIAADAPNVMDGGDIKLPILEQTWMLNVTGGSEMACVFHRYERCSIYTSRPNTCVAFAAGSAKCQELRRDHGLTELQPVDAPDTTINRIETAAREYEDELTEDL